jgi:hypothetical protein
VLRALDEGRQVLGDDATKVARRGLSWDVPDGAAIDRTTLDVERIEIPTPPADQQRAYGIALDQYGQPVDCERGRGRRVRRDARAVGVRQHRQPVDARRRRRRAEPGFELHRETLEPELTVNGLTGPYTYSDMTGAGLDLVVHPPGPRELTP